MKRECERCGEIFTAQHNFRYCINCEFKLQELSELWIDTIDDLMGELRVSMRDMFDDLDDALAYVRHLDTPKILRIAFERIPRYEFYNKQFNDICNEALEPTNQEMAERDDDMMANYWDRRVTEALGK